MKVIKRNGNEEDFCLDNIINAIKKANKATKDNGLTPLTDEKENKVILTVQKKLEPFDKISVEDIQDMVEDSLIKHNCYDVAKSYIKFRENKKQNKKFNSIEEKSLSLIDGTNDELRGDNANKKVDVNSSQRDYLAGIVCKSIAKKTLPKDIVEAHDKGWIHYHDLDYSPVMHLHNCFSSSTEFITNKGVRKFQNFNDGDKVYVKTINGDFKLATVKNFGKQMLQTVELKNRNGTEEYSIKCTKNHRWILKDGSITTNLSVGDILYNNKSDIVDLDSLNNEELEYFCFGMILGDGCDHNGAIQIRLCGEKNKYKSYFDKIGYKIHNVKNSEDKIMYSSNMNFSKQDFLNNKIWKYLTESQNKYIFYGLYCCDGNKNKKRLTSSDERELEFIQYASQFLGYYITSIKLDVSNTEYKTNRKLYYIYFRDVKNDDYGLKVSSISEYREQDVWCVVEPETHTFTLNHGIVTGNCDLLNVEDMLKNGFQMGDVHIDTPKTFMNACNLLAQINLIVSGSQYGGATISWSHLLFVVDRSREYHKKLIYNLFKSMHLSWIPKNIKNKIVEFFVKQDIHTGIKTYQYQILCHQSSNGQTPFVSNNLCLREAETEQELKDFAFIIEEILKRRIKGVKNESGKYISPLFPKLLYWQCEGLNVEKTDPYYYLTELACECVAKRMQPDFQSEKMCRNAKHGQIITNMGCRSLLSDIWEETTYSIDEKFHYQFNENNTHYEGAYGNNFNYKNKSFYGNLKDAICICENEKSDLKNIIINFRGNSGWVISHTDTTVTILKPIVYGRWNEGVVSLNLPMCALKSKTENLDFYDVLDEKMELCRKALLTRHDSVCKIIAKNSPILWQFGALYRTDANTKIKDLIEKYPQRPSISLGFAGLCETCWVLINKSNTSEDGQKLCCDILKHINNKLEVWKNEDKLNYSLYGTPEENLTFKFSMALQKNFGLIEHVTDKDYVVNSYHIDPREEIDAFTKLKIEGQYLNLCKGGAVSYIEVPNMTKNIGALKSVVRFMYDNIYYAEINTKLDTCYKCGFQGEIELIKTSDGIFKFKCPNCGNDDDNEMNCVRRICGYLGTVNSGNTNHGRLDDIFNRKLHL